MIALIALVAISLAGIALMGVGYTSNVVSGNIAFNEAAIQMAEIAQSTSAAEIDAEPDPRFCKGKLTIFRIIQLLMRHLEYPLRQEHGKPFHQPGSIYPDTRCSNTESL